MELALVDILREKMEASKQKTKAKISKKNQKKKNKKKQNNVVTPQKVNTKELDMTQPNDLTEEKEM